jgi:cytochrome P450
MGTNPNSDSLVDPATINSPYAYYSWMRAEEPVHFDAKAGAWLITKYEDIAQAVRMDALSNEFGLAGAHREPWQNEIDDMMRREGFGPHSSADNFNVDPPEHARRRSLVDKAFTAQSIAKIEQHVTEIVRDVMDKFIDRGQADMVSEYSIPISIYVIADMLGLPRDRLDDYKRWSDAAVVPFGRGIGKEEAVKYARDMMEMHRFLKLQIEDRRRSPTDDLISGLVHARINDDESTALNLTELLSGCVALLAAGNETTRNGMSWGAYLLASDPQLLQTLRTSTDQNSALQRFVEETLRIQPPVPQLPRMATQDVEIGGVKIPKGSFIYLCWASGNRDAGKFQNADQFDLTRKNLGAHLTFGQGIHRCVGAMLARMEMKCAAREIVNRLDDYRTTSPGEPEVWGTFVFRGPRTLPVAFKKRAG